MRPRFFSTVPLLLAACGAAAEIRPREAEQTASLPFVIARAESAQAVTLPTSIPAPDPVLRAADLLSITVFRQPDLALEVRIPQNGMISYHLIGSVQAAGRTTGDLEETIRRSLEKDYLQTASVTVTVKEFAERKVYIVGGVTKPDGYLIPPMSRITVLQLVAAAGGFTDRAYKEYAQVVRRKETGEREVIRISILEVEKMLAKGRPEADLELWPDDLVVIPSAARVAYVLGAVNTPGQVEIPTDTRMTIAMAVSHAGSYTKFAATGRLQVLRHLPDGDAKKLTVNLDSILDGGLEQDIELKPGDVVWVPERGIF